MYKPLFNTVIVEIDDKEGEWGGGNDDSMLGRSFRLGTVISVGDLQNTREHPIIDAIDLPALFEDLEKLVGKQIIWNEGVEAGTVFEEDGKTYGMVYWWDIRGVKA